MATLGSKLPFLAKDLNVRNAVETGHSYLSGPIEESSPLLAPGRALLVPLAEGVASLNSFDKM